MHDINKLRGILASNGQDHVLRFWDVLPAGDRDRLIADLDEINWDRFGVWKDFVTSGVACAIPDDLEPAPYYPFVPTSPALEERFELAEKTGTALLQSGAVAAFTVAGGQGTRLGFDAPKGMFPVTPVQAKSLFQLFAEGLARNSEIYDRSIPWYIMTSPDNDAQTRAYFAEQQFFGLTPDDVMFFPQGRMPAFHPDGRLILAEKGRLALSPDGHGGSLRALSRSGALDDMRRRNVTHLSYFQVDNPLVSVIDPLFIGLHHLDGAELSSRCIAKTGPFEKMGVFCQSGGQMQIIEYSDLPEARAVEVDAAGNLRFISGSPAIHIFQRAFIERLNQGHFQLPLHRALKKVPYVDDDGRRVDPAEPNGVKLETFVFDALTLTTKAMLLEALREREFAPVKNASGVDSADSARRMMQEEHARWLALRGIIAPRHPDGTLNCEIELSPRRFAGESEFMSGEIETVAITAGQRVYLS